MDVKNRVSCYVVDFQKKELLMVYNKELGKWVQPGGNIDVDDKCLTSTAILDIKKETGIDVELIGLSFQDNIEPIAIDLYNTAIGPQINIQYVGITKDKVIVDNGQIEVRWISLEEMKDRDNIDLEIKEKFAFILNIFNKFDDTIIYNYQKVIKLQKVV